MKPAWDKLGDAYADSSSLMIADVDCTADGKELCQKFGVQGYPTIKYFVDGNTDGEDYSGGRDFESLSSFVEENIKRCDAWNPIDCSEKEKAYIEKMKGKTTEDREKQLTRLKNMEGASMTVELKTWKNQRINILTALTAKDAEGKEEL